MSVMIGLGVIAIIFSTCSASYMSDGEQENEYDKYPSQSLYYYYDNDNEVADYDAKDGTPENRIQSYDSDYDYYDFYEGDSFKKSEINRALPMKGERINCKEGKPVYFPPPISYPGYEVSPQNLKNVSCLSIDFSKRFSEKHTFEAICKPNDGKECITAYAKVQLFFKKKGSHNCWSRHHEPVIVENGCRCFK